MVRFTLQLERILIYVWGIMLPWQTIWIYRHAFINGSVWQYGTLGLYVGEAVLWVLCLVTFFNLRSDLVRVHLNKKKLGSRLIFLFLFIAFPLYTLISAWWSPNIDISIRHALYIIEGYLLLSTILVSRIPLRDWVGAVLVGAVVPSILGLWQWFSQSTISSTLFGLSEHVVSSPGTSIVASEYIGRWLRAYGTFPHPNIFGGYLVFILLCTYIFKLHAEKLRDRLAVVVVHSLVVFALCATFSRSALLGYMFVCSGFFVYALKHHFRILLPLFVATTLTVVCFGALYHDLWSTRAIPISISETRSIVERTDLLDVAWRLHLEQPAVGHGGGLFTHAWYIEDPQLPGYVYQPVHIVLFVILVEYGYLGALLAVLSAGFFIIYGYRQQSGRTRILWAFSLFVPLIVISFFDHYVFTLYPGIMLFFAYSSLFFKFSTSTPQHVHKM